MTTLLGDLDAFYLKHQRCGELDAGVEGERRRRKQRRARKLAWRALLRREA